MTTMTLSTAIRLGAMLKPKATGRVQKDGGTCALGAALEAIGVHSASSWFPIYDHFPIARQHALYPGDGLKHGKPMIVGACCWILNDAGWSREAVADWVEEIEQQHAIPSQPDLTVSVSLQE